jgi:hypothetical protein
MGYKHTVTISLIALGLLGSLGWWGLNLPVPFITPDATSSGAYAYEPKVFPTPAKGQALYQSQLFKIRFLYPLELQVVEYGTGSDSTVVLEDTEQGLGFQIFIVPYQEDQVSEAQLKKDLPSGVMEDLHEIVIDGVRANAFYSSNPVLGETYEVWLIHNGFLYELSTHKSLKEWLSAIISTWQFL